MDYFAEDTIVPRTVEKEIKDSYLRYALSVIISRALPDVRDGLKPSQRRILYAMLRLSLSPSSKHRKCAKICGDTSGDYHPHGESVIYPTLVRMAQNWLMRNLLIDGQGNFGSVDGDPPAQMRYTEARLTHAAIHLTDDLDKDTVDFVSNYDETRQEPTVFPAKFPNLLCNGSSGIAVGMATSIPTHNFKELSAATVMLINDPSTTIEQIMTVMPAPDFPTGGIICGYRGVREAFHTGRGKIVLRSVAAIEEMENDRLKIVITELPYNVNKSRLIEAIADLIHNKELPSISDLRDESDKDGLRIVIELKRGESGEITLNQLYKHTELQTAFNSNMLALDRGLPRLMNVKQMILAWIDHRIEVIRRRTLYELTKAEARAHILEGFLRAIDILDRVVQLIRASDSKDDARQGLVSTFEFSVRQANAILELRLYQLTGLERERVAHELSQLQADIAIYRSMLSNERLIRDEIIRELQEIARHHNSPRKTQILLLDHEELEMEDLIPDEEMVIIISEDDYIKRLPVSAFREQRRGGQGVAGFQTKKEDDSIKSIYVATTHETLLLFTNLGRCYWLKVWQLPETGRRTKGKPIVQLLEDIQPGEKIATLLKVRNFNQPDSFIIMATASGIIKKTDLSAFSNPRRKGIVAVGIDPDDHLIAARLSHPGEQVMLFTRQGMAVRFDQSQIRSTGRGARGVKGVTLKSENDLVVSCEVVQGEASESILVVCERGFGKRSSVEDFRLTHRGGSGVRSIITSERNGLVVAALLVSDLHSILMISSSGQTIRIPMNQLRVMGRSTQGVTLAHLKDGQLLVAVQRLETSEELPQNEEGSSEKSDAPLLIEGIIESIVEGQELPPLSDVIDLLNEPEEETSQELSSDEENE